MTDHLTLGDTSISISVAHSFDPPPPPALRRPVSISFQLSSIRVMRQNAAHFLYVLKCAFLPYAKLDLVLFRRGSQLKW